MEGYTGCATNVSTYFETICGGKHKCEVKVSSLVDLFQPCKKDFVSYLEASYKCVKGNKQNSFMTDCQSVSMIY